MPSLRLVLRVAPGLYIRIFLCFLSLLTNVIAGENGAGPPPRSNSETPATSRYWHPAFDPVSTSPLLPQVLLIGDSISIDYTLHVRGLLARIVDVHRPAANCGSTVVALKELDQWLGTKKWDVIHFNWGLHDLVSVRAGDNPQLMSNQTVPVDKYEKNLEALVTRLQETGAKLVWAMTTPVPEGARNRIAGCEAKYNAIARRIMLQHGVTIDDLHAFVLPRLNEAQISANVHFTPEGSMLLAKQVALHILEALGRPAILSRSQ